MQLFFYAIIGGVAGLFAGLLGVTGGVITVPALIWIFAQLNFPENYVAHFAIGTSLASMVASSLSSTWAHHKNRYVLWEVVRSMLPGLLLGSALGAFLAHLLSGALLTKIFAVFVILVSVFFWKKGFLYLFPHYFPSPILLNSVGCGIGGISSLLGSGGGIITVPCLTLFQIPEKKAIGTSAAVGLFNSFCGALFYLYLGFHQTHVPDTLGYIHIPAFLLISFMTFLTAPLGAQLTQRLDVSILRKIFAVALAALGFSMLWLT